MKDAGGVVQAQVRALLDLVEARREQRCRELVEAAETRARELKTRARRAARERMAEAVRQERARARHALELRGARVRTRERQRQQAFALDMLGRCWQRLERALLERWHDPQARRAWLAAIVEQALAVLPAAPWQIEHPPDWDPAELTGDDALGGRIVHHTGQGPELSAVPELDAGLRILVNGACLDASRQGLLTDRSAVEASLLAALDRRLAEQQEQGEGH